MVQSFEYSMDLTVVLLSFTYSYGLLFSLHSCRQFSDACGQALNVNERLIKEDQLEYQMEMKAHYKDMLTELSAIMNEQVSTHDLKA